MTPRESWYHDSSPETAAPPDAGANLGSFDVPANTLHVPHPDESPKPPTDQDVPHPGSWRVRARSIGATLLVVAVLAGIAALSVTSWCGGSL